jgi:ankyrin repeat protein
MCDKVSVFHLAEYGHIGIMKLLVDHAIWYCGKGGLDELLHSGNLDGKTPLHLAVWGDPKPAMVTLLLNLGTNANVQSSYHYTPLHWAAKHGHVESAHILLRKGVTSP